MKKRDITNIINRFGSPLYLYDGNKIERQYEVLKKHIPANFEIFYSLKANPLYGVLQLINRFGANIEVASEGELYLALKANFSANKIIYTCPGKTEEGIELAIDNNIYCFNIESLDEAILINTIARKKKKSAAITLRINPNFSSKDAKLQMTGVSSQFGLDIEILDSFFSLQRTKLMNLQVIGIHVYSGTQILNAESIISNVKSTIKLAIEISHKYNFNLKFIDLGGGFGVSYQPNDEKLNLEVLKIGINSVWTEFLPYLRNTRVAFETGRFLLADSGTFITKVLSKKISRGINYIICDGGYSQHPSASYIGRYNENRFFIKSLKKMEEKEKVTIVGPTGTPVDILGKDILIEPLERGDILVIETSGAYGLSNSCILFMSHKIPAEIMLYNKNVHILRERGTLDDLLKGQYDFKIECLA